MLYYNYEIIEKAKKYLKDTEKTEKFYFEGLKEKTIDAKYQYLKNHFQYDIMNSWNNLKTYANNVKIYNLGLTNEQENAFFEINEINFEYIWQNLEFEIEDFKEIFENTFDIFGNGRQGGYLCIIPHFDTAKKWRHLLDFEGLEDVLYYDNYKEFKSGQYNYFYNDWKRLTYKSEIETIYYILKCFDRLCDILRAELIYLLDNYEIETETITETKEIKTIVLN